MQRFVLKKLFDIRPLTKKGELNLAWILRGGHTVKIRKIFSSEKEAANLIKQKKRASSKQKKQSSQINYPAWENWKRNIIASADQSYPYEDIREAILKELEAVEIKDALLAKKDLNPPLNLPVEKELIRQKRGRALLRRLFPQTINLRQHLPSLSLPQISPSLKYLLAGTIILFVGVFSFYFVQKIPATKNFVLTSSNQAYLSLISGGESLLKFQPQAAAKSFQSAYQNFNNASRSINGLGGALANIVDIFPLRYKIKAGKLLLQAGKNISQAGTYYSKGLSVVSDLDLSDFFAQEENSDNNMENKSPLFYLKNFQQQISLGNKEMDKAIAIIQKVKQNDLPAQYRQQFASLQKTIPLIRANISKFNSYFDIFLGLLGEKNPRHYLFLFQNNSEIRATGGFIGSYALLEIYQGQIQSLEVKNIFDADGQLTVNIIPPKPIQKISSGWSTHDANWFFDFPTSAKKVAWFFEKTGGPTIDGIVALTPKLIENILSLTGPIPMPSYGLTISKDNFVTEIQAKVEKDYDPYQNKPKKILADFTELLFQKLASLPKDKWPQFVEIAQKAFSAKDLFLWSKDQKEEQLIQEQGWGGQILSPPGDYLAIVHSNINGYKTDRFMTEEVSLDVSLSSGQILHNLVITRRHTGGDKSFEWYNKVNADYVRIYLPKGSKLIKASGNTKEINIPPLDYQKAGFKKDPLVSSIEKTLVKDQASGLDIFQESGKTVIGGWLYTSPKEKTVFELTYTVPQSVLSKKELKPLLPIEGDTTKINYSLTIQKQAGSYNDPFRLSVSYPENWRIQRLSPQKNLTSQAPIRFRDTISQDKVFNIEFSLEN